MVVKHLNVSRAVPCCTLPPTITEVEKMGCLQDAVISLHSFTSSQICIPPNDNTLWERVVFEVVLPANFPVLINKSPSAANHSHQFASPAMRPSTHKLVVGNWCCRCRKIGSLMGSNKFTCSKRRWKTTGKWNGTKNWGWFKKAKGIWRRIARIYIS